MEKIQKIIIHMYITENVPNFVQKTQAASINKFSFSIRSLNKQYLTTGYAENGVTKYSDKGHNLNCES